MSNLPVVSINPIITASVEAITYDHLWITDLKIFGDDPSNVRLYCIRRPAGFDSAGNRKILVLDGTERVTDLTDLFGILTGSKIIPKLTADTISMGGNLIGQMIAFLNAVDVDLSVPDSQ